MKKVLLLALSLSLSLFADSYKWEKQYDEKEFKGTAYHINYERNDYNEKDVYTTYSSDLSKDYSIQRKREQALKD